MLTDLAQQLADFCEKFKLREKAFESFEELFLKNNEDDSHLSGYKKSELKPIFDGHRFNIRHSFLPPTVDTKISLYTENALVPVGYYILETDYNGEIVDDFFVIEKEKYVDSINMASHFQHINESLPAGYLKRNHIQYPLVSYLSLAGTLFMSKKYESSGRFVLRAYVNLEETGEAYFEQDFLKKTKRFLKMMKNYYIEKQLISPELKADFERWGK
ncbi:hypothetical protein [Chryseobacterium hagamense]|uniref:Uncharacterized protein n=1 Tax=Chryseobacterium hagamense TaxID=395935 RepID=A0A511YQU8_9FLAO|nr:hypothetical protein [Chryseobacterium hagamense]GEN77570.1 hypothetical protein CHA01nite_33100 [Chryseobacterium hagamense]